MKDSKSAIALIAVTAVLLGVGAFFAFGFGGNAGSRPITGGASHRQTASLSNIKQIALAALIYASDYDDHFPPRMDDPRFVEMVLGPYMRNPGLWRSTNPAGGIYLGNPEMSIVPATELVFPTDAVLFYEQNKWSDGRRAVAFGDGSARLREFDPTTGLAVELTQQGREFVEKARSAGTLTAPKTDTEAEGPLGMPSR